MDCLIMCFYPALDVIIGSLLRLVEQMPRIHEFRKRLVITAQLPVGIWLRIILTLSTFVVQTMYFVRITNRLVVATNRFIRTTKRPEAPVVMTIGIRKQLVISIVMTIGTTSLLVAPTKWLVGRLVMTAGVTKNYEMLSVMTDRVVKWSIMALFYSDSMLIYSAFRPNISGARLMRSDGITIDCNKRRIPWDGLIRGMQGILMG